MLDDTLVVWGGEFGRTPMSQGGDGRDHHIKGFSFMLAGGGIKGGITYGATDELGYAAQENPVACPISTRPCCTCWASIIAGSPSNFRGWTRG